jgi:hypothetical protein
MEWGHLANLIRMGLHHQLLSKGFEMKQIIITFTMLMLATTSAFAQLSPDQMRAEMAKPANASGQKFCPTGNEYDTIALKKAYGGDGASSPCLDLHGDAWKTCDTKYWDCHKRWSEDNNTINAYNAWIRNCNKPQQQSKPMPPPPAIKPSPPAPTPTVASKPPPAIKQPNKAHPSEGVGMSASDLEEVERDYAKQQAAKKEKERNERQLSEAKS